MKYAVAHRITPSLVVSLGQMSYKLFSFYRKLLFTSSFSRVMKNSIIHCGAPIHTRVVLQYFHSDDRSDDLHAAEIELGLLTVSAVQLKHWSQMHGGLVHLQITRLKLATDAGERFVVAITRDLPSVSFLQSERAAFKSRPPHFAFACAGMAKTFIQLKRANKIWCTFFPWIFIELIYTLKCDFYCCHINL